MALKPMAPKLMAPAGPRRYTPQGERTKKPTFCYQCVAGPDLLTVEEEDGVAVRVESNYGASEKHPGGGRVCVKAYGLVQKTHNPNRIKTPMKRTNPKKGRNHDPGFVAISWDEAYDIVAGKLNEIRAKGLKDESGYPRLAASFGGGGTPTQYMGTFPAFLKAWGPADLGFGAGQGVKCYHSEHLYGEFWHRAFIVSPDVPYCNFVISCGNNVDASAGVAGVWREADARVRGLRRIQVEPHLSVSAASAGEWVPIKPKTDAAFLFALIHHIVCTRDWQQVCDIPYLRERTNSPYLVAPNGYYLRDPQTGDPLVWDLADNAAKPFDQAKDPALTVDALVSGVERGADNEEWQHESIPAKTSFDALREHVAAYSPEWAEEISDVPAAKIRQLADEFLAHARVGETIEIDGVELPYRPVAVMLGKSVNNGWGGYQATWARTVLSVLVGALEVPGGTLGTNGQVGTPGGYDRARVRCVTGDPMGSCTIPVQRNHQGRNGKASTEHSQRLSRCWSPWSSELAMVAGAWTGPSAVVVPEGSQPDHWPSSQTKPDMWICYRSNPGDLVVERAGSRRTGGRIPLRRWPSPTPMDETNHMADVLLPEASDLESTAADPHRLAPSSIQNFWKHEGWADPSTGRSRVSSTAMRYDRRSSTALAQPPVPASSKSTTKRSTRGAAGHEACTVDGIRTIHLPSRPTLSTIVETIWDRICQSGEPPGLRAAAAMFMT